MIFIYKKDKNLKKLFFLVFKKSNLKAKFGICMNIFVNLIKSILRVI